MNQEGEMNNSVMSEIPIDGKSVTNSSGNTWRITVNKASTVGEDVRSEHSREIEYFATDRILDIELAGPTCKVRLIVPGFRFRVEHSGDVNWVLRGIKTFLDQPERDQGRPGKTIEYRLGDSP